jgi:hypothetical protein
MILKGWDTIKISDEVWLPTDTELILKPFLEYASMEYAYKVADSDIRYLLDRIPLKNNRKYVTVTTRVNFLQPNVIPVLRERWHVDSDHLREEEVDTIHLLLSEATSMTQFLKDDFETGDGLNVHQKPWEMEIFISNHLDKITPVSVQANHFVTFTGIHPHRCIRSTKPEFRYMFRVIETDLAPPYPDEKAIRYSSLVYRDNPDISNITKEYIDFCKKDNNALKSIEKFPDGKIVIHTH